ncbi:MAG: hypothetical protein Q8Q08_10140 [Candidatus Omnitrophota bacterium]|nr:hypothetical protein [Candidatus Omnitrophota bacterium]
MKRSGKILGAGWACAFFVLLGADTSFGYEVVNRYTSHTEMRITDELFYNKFDLKFQVARFQDSSRRLAANAKSFFSHLMASRTRSQDIAARAKEQSRKANEQLNQFRAQQQARTMDLRRKQADLLQTRKDLAASR